MQNRLKEYFPLIREREEILDEIHGNPQLSDVFESWRREQQEEFLDFLSELLKQRVKIVKVLPNDSVRIAMENSLLITDLVVQLADGSLANIEIQKIGYLFPGERASCYSADLLLRQYKRIRDERKKKFSYKDIKPVYTIVLFEQSPSEFHKFPDTYLHSIESKSDSGISLNLLQKYLFIPLDIFQKIYHNKSITNKAEAWLAFLCMEEPEDVIRLISDYPQFKPMYDELYQMCLNTEKIMGLFSKELQILDENTVQYMMDEMQNTINEKQSAIQAMQEAMEEKQNAMNEMQEQLGEKDGIIADRDSAIAEKDATIQHLQKRIKELESGQK